MAKKQDDGILEDNGECAAELGKFGQLVVRCPKCKRYCAKMFKDIFDEKRIILLVCSGCGFRDRYRRIGVPPEDVFEE